MVTKDKIIRKGENDMLSFESDYTEGAHEAILKRLAETNREQTPGYGADPYCEAAKEKIAGACRCPQADIYFLTGGTQTNQTVIDSLLKNYEGVIAAQTGHVNVHEAGAIEFTGHKVLALPQKNGKIEPETLRAYMEAFYKDPSHDHMVFPGMVYISHPTEFGTLYTKAELTALSEICGSTGFLCFRRTRLGYGLMSLDTDVTLEDIARLCDVFYIRHEGRSTVWGGCGIYKKECSQTVCYLNKAAWSAACKRASSGAAVRYSVYRWAVL